jgi:hypothetical protein
MMTYPLQTADLTARLILGPTPADDRLATVITWLGNRLAVGYDPLPAECWDAIEDAWDAAKKALANVARPAQMDCEGPLNNPEHAWINHDATAEANIL